MEVGKQVNLVESVKRYGYSQNEIANHLGMHYSTISRLMKEID
jgi:transposase